MRILALTSDPTALSALTAELPEDEVVVVHSLSEGLTALRTGEWALVLLHAPRESDVALDLLERLVIAKHRVIVLAGDASMGATLEALARGATEVVAWPPAGEDLRQAVARCALSGEACARVAADGVPATALLGESPGMERAYKVLARVARSSATVLLQGESGTGKELFAQLVHRSSARANGPFVAINCAAIPEHLLESDLFGHEKGAFTGAVGRRIGRFERATGGTLFLDEVGDMSPALQAKILRALQEREIERVGGDDPIPVDVRVVAASHRDLRAEVAAGRFRADLYYRLAVVVITLPPLRQRGDDIQLLAEYFIARFAAEYRRPVTSVAHSTVAALRAHPWPGNVRQLRNAMERAVLLAEGPVLLPGHLPPEIREPALGLTRPPITAICPGGDRPVGVQGVTGWQTGSLRDEEAGSAIAGRLLPLEELERRHIAHAMARTAGHLARAADLLGIHRNTLRRKLHEHAMVEGPRTTEQPLLVSSARPIRADAVVAHLPEVAGGGRPAPISRAPYGGSASGPLLLSAEAS